MQPNSYAARGPALEALEERLTPATQPLVDPGQGVLVALIEQTGDRATATAAVPGTTTSPEVVDQLLAQPAMLLDLPGASPVPKLPPLPLHGGGGGKTATFGGFAFVGGSQQSEAETTGLDEAPTVPPDASEDVVPQTASLLVDPEAA